MSRLCVAASLGLMMVTISERKVTNVAVCADQFHQVRTTQRRPKLSPSLDWLMRLGGLGANGVSGLRTAG